MDFGARGEEGGDDGAALAAGGAGDEVGCHGWLGGCGWFWWDRGRLVMQDIERCWLVLLICLAVIVTRPGRVDVNAVRLQAGIMAREIPKNHGLCCIDRAYDLVPLVLGLYGR